MRQNALAMLTYTESSRRSNYGRSGLAHSGAFTDGGAAFCMNRDLFWNHFLLDLLKEINQKTEVIPQKSRNLKFEIRYLLGKNSKHRGANDHYFGWKQQTKDGQPHWVWKGDAQKHADKWGDRRTKWYKYAQEGRNIHRFLSGAMWFMLTYCLAGCSSFINRAVIPRWRKGH